jgi:hypothetical protein
LALRVLLNATVSRALDPARRAIAFATSVSAGRDAYRVGPMTMQQFAVPSIPVTGQPFSEGTDARRQICPLGFNFSIGRVGIDRNGIKALARSFFSFYMKPCHYPIRKQKNESRVHP